jgi:hypothetical protein
MGKIRRFATRTIKGVPLTFEDESGQRVTENFDVVYRSYSNRVIDEMAAVEETEKDSGGNVPYSVMLAYVVDQIWDQEVPPQLLTGDDGKPALVELPAEDGEGRKSAIQKRRAFFELMPIADDTRVIYERIQEDINPQNASSAPGPSGSTAAASEA